ncbi:MAG: nucleotidyltransferase family protein [Pseudomonadota bacterium]
MIEFTLKHEVVGEVATFSGQADLQLPEPLPEAFGQYSVKIRNNNKNILRATVAIQSLLANEGIKAFFAKGAVWDRILRDVENTRTSKDLDVYVQLDDVEPFSFALEREFQASALQPLEKSLSTLHHHSLWFEEFDIVVEVHWALAAPWHGLNFDINTALNSTKRIDLLESRVETLSAPLMINFCALELSKDSWVSIKKILDFSHAYQSASEADRAAAVKLSRHGSYVRALEVAKRVSAALGLLNENLAPSDAFPGKAVATVSDVAVRRLAEGGAPGSVTKRALEGLLYASKHDRLRSRIYHCWRIIIVQRFRRWFGREVT